ncbi:MAG TPA: hypothetical protein PLU73_04980, partial [Bacteroidia bacterium]|nr:hypothetical protein [Bacteroidia bacterium]
KVYRFTVNARTGEVQGERPYSAWKIFFLCLSIAIVIGTGIFFYKKYQDKKKAEAQQEAIVYIDKKANLNSMVFALR